MARRASSRPPALRSGAPTRRRVRDAGRVRYEGLATEQPNAASRDLDRLSPLQIATLMNREDRRAVAAVGRAAPRIAAAVDLIVSSLASGGRLIFAGAGTSGT